MKANMPKNSVIMSSSFSYRNECTYCISNLKIFMWVRGFKTGLLEHHILTTDTEHTVGRLDQ